MDETLNNFGDTFAAPADTGGGSSDFSGVSAAAPGDSTNGPAGNPVTPRLISLATNADPTQALTDQAIASAQNIVDSGNEFQTRLQVAADRQTRQALNVQKNRSAVSAAIADSLPSADATAATDSVYNSIIGQNNIDNAKASVERESVDRIHDDLSSGQPVEAKLTYDLMFGRGGAEKVFYNEAAKNLILAQKIGQYQQGADETSWLGKAYDWLTSNIPLNDNFAHVGDVPGAAGGLKNFLLSGTSLQSQGEYAWNKYDTPEKLSDALADGGELDSAIRSNATTLGHTDLSAASGILRGLDYENDSDRQWSNMWSAANVGLIVPWAKVASIPKLLTNIGSRSLARAAVVDAADAIATNGVDAGVAKSGISAADTLSNLEPSTLNPNASGPNRVPLAVDANSSLAAMERLRSEMPTVFQASGYTNVAELQAARSATVNKIVAETGRPIKDVKYTVEDLATGERSYVSGNADLPEQGHVVHGVEVTWGKADGGGFARPETAISSAMNKLGVVGAKPVFEDVGSDIEQTAAEAGFTDRAFHGTGRSFDSFDPAMAGSATGAENTRGGVSFFSDEPDVAGSYAKKAAAAINHADVESARQAFHAEPTDANADRFDEALSRVMDDSGANIRPVDIDKRNFAEHDMGGRAYNGPETQAIIDHARATGKDGVVFKNYDDDVLNGKPSTVYAVFDHSKVRSAFEGPIVKRDTSGQWFATAHFHVPENGFKTTPLNTPSSNFFAALRSDSRRIDRDGWQKAIQGGVNGNMLVKETEDRLKGALKGVDKTSKLYLDEIIRKGQNASKWFSDREFNSIFERATGNLPSEKVLNAYKVYHEANDFDFVLRREQLYKTEVNAGREHVRFNLGPSDFNVEGPAKVEIGGERPTERVYDASTHTTFNTRTPLTQQEFDRMSGEGYLKVTLKESVQLPDKTNVRTIMIKRADLERRALSRDDVLGYSEGGHRAYTGKFFAKQGVEGVQPDTGTKYLKNPNVFRTSNNPRMLREWAATMNTAIRDAKTGILDPQHFEDNLFANAKGISYPTGEEFVKGFNDGMFDLHHPIEVVGDRELPSIYSKARDDADRFFDDTETSTGGYYRTTGRLYTSGKGEALRDESGNFAETVDPWQTTADALSNINKLQSFDAYKSNVFERFKNTYASDLKLRQLENVSAFDMLNAPVREDVSSRMARMIRSEQGAVKRIMKYETPWEANVRGAQRELAEWVLGHVPGEKTSLMAHDFVYWLGKNNPVNFLRGLAFDAKLGFFNAGQFVKQTGTMAVALALSPAHGLKGFGGTVPLFAYVTSKGSESVLETLASNGAWKLAGFKTPEEFKEFNRFFMSTGFHNVSSSHLSINDLNPTRMFGAMGKVDAARQAGRAFFYQAELANRAVAGRIAWEELKDHGYQLGSNEFRNRWLGLSDDYSLNMQHESSAQFQHGLWSIPTQFWGYNIRMMDAMLGSRFTTAQKTRLLASQFLLWGAAGVPVADVIDEYVKQSVNDGQPTQTGSIMSLFDRGTVDNALAAITGADVRLGESIGVNTSFIKDIFGLGGNAPKSALDVLGGATFTISKQIGSTLANVVQYAYAETGADQGYPITRDMVLKLASNISTLGNGIKAMQAANYGMYVSGNGTVQASDIPKQDAFAIALGFVPNEINNAQEMANYTKNQDDVIKDAATQVRNWRQEAMNNPDALQENMRKVNLFMKLLPPSVALEVQRRANKITDESTYDSVVRKYQRERMSEANDGPANNDPQ